MYWEFFILAALLFWGFGAAIFMARKTKATPITVVTPVNNNQVDLEELATRVARAVGKEIAEEISKYIVAGGHKLSKRDIEEDIEIDESLIPISIELAIDKTNLEGMTREEEKKDEKLESSKTKLAEILKGK